jgi:HipA-like C-terminal domain
MTNMDKFIVVQVPSDAARVSEVMGTKRKFWFQDNELGSCLFKFARLNTGEDWAEKIAAELCLALDLPYARQELGIWQEQRGTVSPEFLTTSEELIHGNDVLYGIAPNYPREERYNMSEHTLAIVLPALTSLEIQIPLNWTSPHLIENAVDTFVGYLLLDAWIGNGDRHHENWGVVRTQVAIHLAPTYDHASSLGRELLEKDLQKRLQNKTVDSYLNKNYSAF